MDSRQMYQATTHLSSLVTWDKDWIHFGTDDEIEFELIEGLIDEHLKDKEVLFINERTNSQQYGRNDIIEVIKPFLGKKDFQIWTVAMNKVIGFNRIGVLHLGQKR